MQNFNYNIELIEENILINQHNMLKLLWILIVN